MSMTAKKYANEGLYQELQKAEVKYLLCCPLVVVAIPHAVIKDYGINLSKYQLTFILYTVDVCSSSSA